MVLNFDRKLIISSASSRSAEYWPAQNIFWSELLSKLAIPERGTETHAEYMGYSKTKQDHLKDVGGFVAGALIGGKRKANSVSSRDIVVLDLDNIPPGGTTGAIGRLETLGCAFGVYSTRKHDAANPRLRVLIPTDRTLGPDEYEPIARSLGRSIGIELCDKTTFQASRLMYWPSCSADSNYVYTYKDNPFVQADAILAGYKDWHDVSEWPLVPGEAQSHAKTVAKQEDPTTKKGSVGAFCRLYNIYRVMDEIIPGEYEPCSGSNERFTFTGGSTVGGAVIYDSGNFLFSHHATDPTCGKLVNSFDLVRLNKFGMLDDEAKPGTPMNKQPSFMAAMTFIEDLPEIKEFHAREAEEQFAVALETDTPNAQLVFFEEKRFILRRLINWVYARHRIIQVGGRLFVYKNGKYEDGEDDIAREITNALGEEMTPSRVKDTIAGLKLLLIPTPTEELGFPPGLINIKNGWFNIRTWEVYPHTPDIKSVGQIDIEFDPTKPRDTSGFDDFIEMVNPVNKLAIEESIGHCFLATMAYETAVMFYATSGNNGKGTIIELIGRLFGKENTSYVTLQALAIDKFAAANLFGKMVNLTPDLQAGMLEDAGMFKQIVSGDKVTAEKKYKDSFQFSNQAKLIFSSNHLPTCKNSDPAYFRRWLIIPFDRQFTDHSVRNRLLSPEGINGAFIRAVEGAQRLMLKADVCGVVSRKSFTATEEMNSINRIFINYADRMEDFFSSEVISLDPSCNTPKQAVYDTYRKWCEDSGIRGMSQQAFNLSLKSKYNLVDKQIGKDRKKCWVGLKIEGSYLANEFNTQ